MASNGSTILASDKEYEWNNVCLFMTLSIVKFI